MIASQLAGPRFLMGVAAVLVVLVAAGWGAWSMRRLLLPSWTGATARLVEVIVALAVLTTSAQLLGTVGAFRAGWMVVVPAAIGLALGTIGVVLSPPRVTGRPADTQAGDRGASFRIERAEVALVIVAIAIVGAQWITHIADAVRRGMMHPDTLWFHGPYVARFAQRGRITGLLDGVDLLHSYGPQNSELLHASGVLAFGRDFLSPLLNLGWAALVLLAAWVIGRRHHVQALSLLGAVVVLGLPIAAATQPGQVSNDVATSALLLAAVALLLEGDLAPAPTAVAAISAGLALGTRLTVAGPLLLLTVAVVFVALRRRRLAPALVWCGFFATFGAYWFVRNWSSAGTPLPFFQIDLGPIHWDRVVTPGASLSEYWTDGSRWADLFLPGLRQGFGPVWPVVLALALTAAVGALVRRRSVELERFVGATIVFGIITYAYTPLTADAGGLTFVFNLRYLMPTLLIAFAVLPWGLENIGPRWRAAAGLGLLTLAIVDATASHHENTPAWPKGVIGYGVAFGAIALLAVPVWHRLHALPPRQVFAAAMSVIVLATAGIWLLQRAYADRRYADTRLVLDPVYDRFRDLEDEKIATFGVLGGYPLFGTELSNIVEQPTGPIDPDSSESCRWWRRKLTEDGYTYVVFAREVFSEVGPPEPWVGDDPSAALDSRDRYATVYRITDALHPQLCEVGPGESAQATS